MCLFTGEISEMQKKEIKSLSQLPVMPLTIQDMTWNNTGTWRVLTPLLKDKTPPCRAACPIGNPVPHFIEAVKLGEVSRALELLLRTNPLPGITGRLCYHPCQTNCLRKELDENIAIQELEKYVADHGDVTDLGRSPAKGRKIAVAGAGPAGLACGYFLGLEGYEVTIFEPTDRAGGFLNLVGANRLDRAILDREITRLVKLSGLVLKVNVRHPPASDFDLVLTDESAYAPGSASDQAVRTLASGGKNLLSSLVDRDFSGFKPVQIARAVALGAQMAEAAGKRLAGRSHDGRVADDVLITSDDIKFSRFQKTAAPARSGKKGDLSPAEAVTEAERCLSCGTCNLCQLCTIACPDACLDLDESGQRVVIDLFHCKGCGICAYECPRGVLVMENE